MSKQHWYLAGAIISLVVVAFGVGLVLVMPRGGSWLGSLPVVGEWLGGEKRVETVDEKVLQTTYARGGLEKMIGENGILYYIVRGRLVDDVVVRVDGMLQGKLVIDGHLQSQPLGILAGSVDGRVYLGVQENGAVAFRETENGSAAKVMQKGRRIEITVLYDPNNPGQDDKVVMLEKLAAAMNEHRRYEGDEPMTVYSLKVAVLE